MQNYTKHYNTRKTPQSEAIPGREDQMAENYAGGFSFVLDDWKMLDRFLILGSDKPTYYASSKTLTKENAKNLMDIIKKDAVGVVDRIVEISNSGRAPNNDPALFALAMVAGLADDNGKKYALDNLSKVARIGTHLFHFVNYQAFRGWGRGLRNGISKWYTEKNIKNLAYQVVKYQSRDGWSHRDILRLAHTKPINDEMNTIFGWITHGVGGEVKKNGAIVKSFPHSIDDVKNIPLIYGFELAKRAKNEDEVVKLIKEYNLPREAIPTQFMGKKVYETLLPKMPMTALIRNLGNLSKHGILEPGNFDDINFVVEKITRPEVLRKARVHPIQLLMALRTYGAGRGSRGHGEWKVVPQIVDALDEAFYLSFGNIEPTGKKILVALDVSGSMGMYTVAGIIGLTPRAAAAAMAMVTMKAEKNWSIVGFTASLERSYSWGGFNNNGITPLNLSPRMRLDDVENYVEGLNFGATDCALPAIWAKQNKKNFDAIVIYTDNESWAGDIAPSQALVDYRNSVGHDVKMVSVGMTATQYSIADPDDPSMLDVVGFDTAAPSIIQDFIADKI